MFEEIEQRDMLDIVGGFPNLIYRKTSVGEIITEWNYSTENVIFTQKIIYLCLKNESVRTHQMFKNIGRLVFDVLLSEYVIKIC